MTQVEIFDRIIELKINQTTKTEIIFWTILIPRKVDGCAVRNFYKKMDPSLMNLPPLYITRKYLLREFILGEVTHATAWDGDETLNCVAYT